MACQKYKKFTFGWVTYLLPSGNRLFRWVFKIHYLLMCKSLSVCQVTCTPSVTVEELTRLPDARNVSWKSEEPATASWSTTPWLQKWTGLCFRPGLSKTTSKTSASTFVSKCRQNLADGEAESRTDIAEQIIHQM